MSNKQFKLILNNLDDRIDKLVSKHGMTPRIEKINEEWVDLMHAFHTDYRGVSDDDELVRLATEIYREINYTQQYEERPLDARLSELKVGISATGANAIRYGDSIVINDSDEELTKINTRYNEIHGIAGVRVNFSNKGGPTGLMYDQRHGHNLFQLKMADKDLSNKALGDIAPGPKKRSREWSVGPKSMKKVKKTFPYFMLPNTIIFVVGDDKTFIKTWLNDRKIPYVQDMNGNISVQSNKYEFVYELFGTPRSAIKVNPVIDLTLPKSTVSTQLYKFNDLPVLVSTPNIIETLRTKLGKTRKVKTTGDDFDLFMFNGQREIIIASTVTRFNVGDISKSEILPEKYKSLLYSLYPSRKPNELITNRVSAPTDDIYGVLEDFPPVKDPFLDYVLDDFDVPISHVQEPFITFNGEFVKDWFHFRGNVYYQHPWVRHINNASLTNNYVFVSDHRQTAFFHIAVKRESSWTKEILKWNRNLGSNLSVSLPFAAFVEQKEFLEYDFVVTFLIHEFSVNSRHANSIVIDNVNKLIIRFEPHGYMSTSYDLVQCDMALTTALKNYDPLSNYTYIGPSKYEQINGPQTIERHDQSAYMKIVAKIGSSERVLEAGGFCLAWSILFCHYYYNNSMYGYNYTDVYKHLDLTPNELAKLIRHFQGWLVNMTKQEKGDKYVPPTGISKYS